MKRNWKKIALTSLLSLTLTLPLASYGQAAARTDLTNMPPTYRDVLLDTVKNDNGAARELRMNIFIPPTAQKTAVPVLVYVHGGGWAKGSYEGDDAKKRLSETPTSSQGAMMDKDNTSSYKIFKDVLNHGIAFVSVDYRLNSEAALPAQIYDVKGALRFLRAHAHEYGIDESMATIAYSVFGIATMTGAIACGYICLHHSLKNVLGTLYALRALIAFVFIFFMPKDLISVMIFITLLGLTCDATITPTSELISHKYGPSLLGVLFGAAYLCHQFGSFLSSSIGGFIVDRTGNYETVWIIDIALCSFASLICYAIGESRKHQKNGTAARHADSPMHLPSLLNIR